MLQTFTVQLDKPIASVKMLDSYSGSAFGDGLEGGAGGAEQVKLMQDLENQRTELSHLLLMLKGLVDKLNQFYENVFAEHKEEIAKLSMEIARKILVRKVQEKDYEIESIIQEALKNAPTRQDVVVHLNPEDLVQYQKVQQDGSTEALAGIKFISDPSIGRAECLLETPKGIIKSSVDEHLERIGKALVNGE